MFDIYNDGIFDIVAKPNKIKNESHDNDIFYLKCKRCKKILSHEDMGKNSKTEEQYKSCEICRENAKLPEKKIARNKRNRKLYANKTPTEKEEFKKKQKVYEIKCKESQNKLRRDWKRKRREKLENRKIDAEKAKEYRKNNIEKFKEKEKKYRDAHKEEISKKQKEYKAKNREVLLERRKQYRIEHREEINKRQNELRKIKMEKLQMDKPKTKSQLKLDLKQEKLKNAEEELNKINPLETRNCQRCTRIYSNEQFGINPINFTYYKNCEPCRDAQKLSDAKRCRK